MLRKVNLKDNYVTKVARKLLKDCHKSRNRNKEGGKMRDILFKMHKET